MREQTGGGGVLSAMWSTGAWRIYPLALLYVTGCCGVALAIAR